MDHAVRGKIYDYLWARFEEMDTKRSIYEFLGKESDEDYRRTVVVLEELHALMSEIENASH